MECNVLDAFGFSDCEPLKYASAMGTMIFLGGGGGEGGDVNTIQ